MMDFFQRRVEALERDLVAERERASAARGLLAQQEALKSEVETHLKSLTDQLRREKIEREGAEAGMHARGRIEQLEKRLDEMNATFAQLLKEAVARRDADGPAAGAPAVELFSSLVLKVEKLAERPPQDEKIFEERVGRRLDELGQSMARALDDWRRSQETERKRLDERMEAMARERGDLARHWEDQARALRDDQAKERAARDCEISRQVSALASRLEILAGEQKLSAQGAGDVSQAVGRIVSILTATPKTKDALIVELEAEKEELRRVLNDRQESLRRFAGERREVEKSMGESLVRLSAELEEERARTRAAEARGCAFLGEIEILKARLARLDDLERAVKDRDDRIFALCAERDELARSLVSEAQKVRAGIEERRAADAEAQSRAGLLSKRLEEEAARRALIELSATDARTRLATMGEQISRACQERDAVTLRFSEWEKERQRLLETLRKKDEMIALLSSTFQGVLKKDS